MRLFIAVDLPEPARLAVVEESNRVRRLLRDSSGTWVKPEHMHLTLLFIGEVGEDRARLIGELIGRDIPLSSFRLTFGGLGVFPPHGPVKTLWIGTQDGTMQAVELQRHVVETLEPAGVAPEARPFHPHLTLARWKRDGAPKRGRVPAAAGVVTEVEVATVTLYHSRLSSSGPTYTALSHGCLSCR
jgi:2'-5' RNA ligase